MAFPWPDLGYHGSKKINKNNIIIIIIIIIIQ